MTQKEPVSDDPPAKPNPRAGIRRTRVIGLLAIAAIVGAGYGLIRTPSWYDPPVIEPSQRQAVRNNLVAAQQSFTEALRSPTQPFVYHLYQDDVNRWIAMRREIFPLIDERMPRDWTAPFVVFDSGSIRLAAKHLGGKVGAIFSLDLSAEFRDDATVLRVVGLRCGSVRVPANLASADLGRKLEFNENELWPGSPRVWGDLVNGFHVGARAEWRNGGFLYRVKDVRLEPGQLNLTIESLGHQPSRRRRNQP